VDVIPSPCHVVACRMNRAENISCSNVPAHSITFVTVTVPVSLYVDRVVYTLLKICIEEFTLVKL
jgi:hypothetical protein